MASTAGDGKAEAGPATAEATAADARPADVENPAPDTVVASMVERWRREDLLDKAALVLRGLGCLFSAMDKMDRDLKQGKVEFSLRGQARRRWRVGVFLSVRFWTHLDCNLRYFYPNGSSTDLHCTSKSH